MRSYLSGIRILALAALALPSASALAVPSFARQTGAECSSCHYGFLDLTSKGRYFKLEGYTLGEKGGIPVAAGVLASRTTTKSPAPGVSDEAQFKDDGRLVIQRLGAYYGGRITEKVGALVNWNYETQERRGRIEMTDIRFSDTVKLSGKNLLYGLSLNNNPGVQDVWHTFGPFSVPFPAAGELTAFTPPANTRVKLDNIYASQVFGATAYGWWDKSLYFELGGYRTADRAFSAFRLGVPRQEAAELKGFNPYWRVAYQHSFSEGSSLMIGALGFNAKQYPDNTDPSGPTDRFRDVGVDANYQYDEGDHRVRATFAYVRERQDLAGSFDRGGASNSSNTLNATKARVTYYFQKKYGATLGYFNTTGSQDDIRYEAGEQLTGSATGRPNFKGYMVEFNYLPIQNLMLGVQYTLYTKFNGAKSDYDGFGRNAKDNNTLFLHAWYLF